MERATQIKDVLVRACAGVARLRPGVWIALALSVQAVGAEPFTIVAVGASNTSGWGVGTLATYPAQLETLLRQRGLAVRVVNAGRPFDTTAGMLGRIDAVVPPETALVILQPGANDLRFLGSRERRAANIAAIVERLKQRRIRSLVYDPVFPDDAYQWDHIHINAAGHAAIAAELLPSVIDALRPSSRIRGVPSGVVQR